MHLPPELQVGQARLPAAGRPGEGGRGVRGACEPGEPLPSIRPLAEELRVNRNTVAKAYAELETPGRHRDHRRQGLLRPRRYLALPQGRPPQAPDRRKWTTRHPGAPPAGRPSEFLELAEERFDAFADAAVAPEPRRHHDTAASTLASRHRDPRPRPPLRRAPTRSTASSLRVAAGTLLRLLRPERRRQDDDHQVPAEPAAPDARAR